MGSTAEQQLEQLGLSPEERQDFLRLAAKIKQNREVTAQNQEVARRSFGEWLSAVLPSVLKGLGVAANIITKLLNSIATLINAL
jgi:hypothetical protein